MFFFDPTYLLFILPGLGLSLWASFRTKSAFKKYSRVPAATGYSGAQAAQLLLDRAGLHDVSVTRTHGFLSRRWRFPKTSTTRGRSPPSASPRTRRAMPSNTPKSMHRCGFVPPSCQRQASALQ